MEKNYKQLIKILEKKLNLEDDENIIEELFEGRSRIIHSVFRINTEFKNYDEKIKKVDEEIRNKFVNNWEIIQELEKYEDASWESGYLCEKLMYKHGVLDGMKLILEGTKQIDITKFLKDNE